MSKFIDVNKDNFNQYRFIDDRSEESLKRMSDEELKAQKFYANKHYRGNGYAHTMKKLVLFAVQIEMDKRGIC